MKNKLRKFVTDPLLYFSLLELGVFIASIPTAIAKSADGIFLMIFFNFLAIGSSAYCLSRHGNKILKIIVAALAIAAALTSSVFICHSLMYNYLAKREGLPYQPVSEYGDTRFYIKDVYISWHQIPFYLGAALSFISLIVHFIFGNFSEKDSKTLDILSFVAPSLLIIGAVLGLIFHRRPIILAFIVASFAFVMATIRWSKQSITKIISELFFLVSLILFMIFALLSWIHPEAYCDNSYYSGGVDPGYYMDCYLIFALISVLLGVMFLVIDVIDVIRRYKKIHQSDR